MQTPKSSSRTCSSDAPQKVSPRGTRQLKPKSLDCATASSSNRAKNTPNERSPKVLERTSPRSPLSQKKQPSRASELESQISKLLEDLNKAKDKSIFSESLTKQAEQDAEESKKQLLAMSAKLDESQKQILQLSEFQNISEEDQTSEAKLVDCVALQSAMNVIQQLGARLKLIVESGDLQTQHLQSANENLELLNVNLADIINFVKTIKTKLNDSEEMESPVEACVNGALLQLEAAKQTVEKLMSEGMIAMEGNNSISLELGESDARVNSLKTLLEKVENGNCQEIRDRTEIETEVEQLKAALETLETKYHEEQLVSAVQIRTAYDVVEQIKSELSLKGAELEKELDKSRADIEDLKASLMDKENELQGISEENEGLHLKLRQNKSSDRESELKKELIELKDRLADLKANYMDKETEFQCVSEENEMLKLEINRRKMVKGKDDDITMEVESARAGEREAVMKLGKMTEEADRNSLKAAKVAEELEMAQAENAELEAEMRKLKVQSDQWRKAAEAAAAILSTGNNRDFIDQSESMDGNYDSITGKDSPYIDGIDDDLLKKKNGNMLKKIGVLWKKQQK